MNLTLKYLLFTMFAFPYTAATLFASFTNDNAPTTVVPYGGTYTYSVSWGFSSGSTTITISDLYLPTSTITVDASYPNPGTFTYTINGVTDTDEGYYQVGFPNRSADAAPVYLSISPAILTEPQNTICISGESTTMGIACGPTNATTYQWFDAATDVPITTPTNTPTFTPAAATNGERVYCQIINGAGQITSTNALLTVGTAPTITAQPTNVSVVLGSSATFSVTAAGSAPLYYQWYQNGFAMQGANIDYITLLQVTNTDTQTFAVVISNLFGPAISSVASLTAGTAPQVVSAVLGSNNSVNLQMTGTPGFSYVLQMTSNLMPPVNWQSVLTNPTCSNGLWSFIDTNTQLCPAKFYRTTVP